MKTDAEKYKASRSGSPAPKKGVCRDFAAGNCKHGDNCNYSHDLTGRTAPAAKSKAEPKGKAKAKAKAGP